MQITQRKPGIGLFGDACAIISWERMYCGCLKITFQ